MSSRRTGAIHRHNVSGTTARAQRSLVQRLPRSIEFYIDDAGRQHFNFRQQVWLEDSVRMAFTPCYTRALETLAVNLLTLATPERDFRAARGATSRRAVVLAERFCEECLLPAPGGAWQLSLATLESWLAAQAPRHPLTTSA